MKTVRGRDQGKKEWKGTVIAVHQFEGHEFRPSMLQKKNLTKYLKKNSFGWFSLQNRIRVF